MTIRVAQISDLVGPGAWGGRGVRGERVRCSPAALMRAGRSHIGFHPLPPAGEGKGARIAICDRPLPKGEIGGSRPGTALHLPYRDDRLREVPRGRFALAAAHMARASSVAGRVSSRQASRRSKLERRPGYGASRAKMCVA